MSGTGPPPHALNTHSFRTKRLVIDLPKADDAERLYQLVGGPDRREVCGTLLWDGPDDISDTQSWVEQCATASFESFGFHWVIRDRTGEIGDTAHEVLGAIGTRPAGEPGRADVGYWLGRPYWGQGIMGEALRQLIAYGFTELDYYRMEANVHTTNERGIRLLESAGMTREGVRRKVYRKYGEFVDEALYGLLRENWMRRRSG